MLGGTTSFSILQDFKNPTINISTTGGYFVGKRIALGLDLSYFFFHYAQPDNLQPIENKTTRHSVSVIPITRIYLGVKKFAPFVDLGYGWSWYSTKSDYGSSSIGGTFNSGYYKAGIGFNQFISQSFAIEGVLCYLKTSEETNYDDGDTDWSLRIGVQYFLNRNKKSITKESSGTFIKKGQWMLGGIIDINTIDFDLTPGSFSPEAGFFVNDNAALGIRFKHRTSTFYNGTAVGPFARYYFNIKRLAPFADIAIGWASGQSDFYNQETNETGISAQASVGFSYFINDFVALESQLSFGFPGVEKPLISAEAGLKFFLAGKK